MFVLCDHDAVLCTSEHPGGARPSHWSFVLDDDDMGWYILEVVLSSPWEELGDPYREFDQLLKKAVSCVLLEQGADAVPSAKLQRIPGGVRGM